MRVPSWNWRRVEVVVLLAVLVVANIALGKLDEWLEAKAPDAWKDIH